VILIGLGYKAGSGKDTVAEQMRRTFGVKVMHFADSLKAASEAIFGFTYEQLSEPSLKEIIDPYWGMSPRRSIQLLGTEACRNVFGATVWTKSLARKMKELPVNTPGVVIADVRFPEEWDFIKEAGGFLVRIDRVNRSSPNHTHSSEVLLDCKKDEEWDYIISNNGSIADLRHQSWKTYALATRNQGVSNEQIGPPQTSPHVQSGGELRTNEPS
jgi:hypothetical protein